MKKIHLPLTIFLIGATGDLAKKKILKAVYQLYREHLLFGNLTLIGNARRTMSRPVFAEYVKKIVEPTDHRTWQSFAENLYYVAGDVTEEVTFQKIKELHSGLNKCGHHLWYLATLPQLYTQAVQNIKLSQMNKTTCGWTKLMLEKPFGTDVATARLLNKELLQVFDEHEIYRIDHFLAKETVQNLLAFRFANGIFEHLWSKDYIEQIQVQGCEQIGIEGREDFYDATGTIRDYVQNHILQMIATTLMEEPDSFGEDDIRVKRRRLLESIKPISTTKVKEVAAFGQFGAGTINGRPVKGYKDNDQISRDSTTETAVAIKLEVTNSRWQGVPIYIRAGKRLHDTVTEISIIFKEKFNQMFEKAVRLQEGNILTLRIQPNEGIVLRLRVKKPGLKMQLEEVPLQFCYKSEFHMDLVEAYAKLIYDAVVGDPTLFPRASEIEAAWQAIEPLLKYKASLDFKIDSYPAGSWGPPSFDELLAKHGHKWYQPSSQVCRI